MGTLRFDPAYSTGIRAMLVDTATTRGRRWRRRRTLGLGLIALLTLGAGTAVAAPFLIPGQDRVTALTGVYAVSGSGSSRVRIIAAPEGTTSIEWALRCDGGGTVRFADGSSGGCDGSTISGETTWGRESGRFPIRAIGTVHWRLTYSFSHRSTTGLGTNARGELYGVDTDREHPDLIAADATNGRQGYIWASDEAAAGCGDVRTPAEAVDCSTHHVPTDIPVYESDGTTQIGVFTIG